MGAAGWYEDEGNYPSEIRIYAELEHTQYLVSAQYYKEPCNPLEINRV